MAQFSRRAVCARHGGASSPRSRIASRAREYLQLPCLGGSRSALTHNEARSDRPSTESRQQQLAAGQVATIMAGTNDPDLIDRLGPIGADGIWLG
jgi:hypothetical protein